MLVREVRATKIKLSDIDLVWKYKDFGDPVPT
jgi:hypothetical protein